MPEWVGWLAQFLGLVPLAYLAWLHARGQWRSRLWWWLGAAFGVSFAADAASLAVGHPLISQAYPLLQSGLFVAVLLPRPHAVPIIGGLALASGLSLALRAGQGLDMVLHVIGWHAVAIAAWGRVPDGWLRVSLAVGFVSLAWAWVAFVAWPSFPTWGTMQAVRLVTAVGFCYSARTEGR